MGTRKPKKNLKSKNKGYQSIADCENHSYKSESMSEALHLYRNLLRQASKLASYNFRQYALRRVRDGFLSNRNMVDLREIQKEMALGHEQLEVLKRQATISQMYSQQKLVIETQKTDSKTMAIES